jgi:hypothetical protein|tara:strand:+ start:105 stop:404 length:300 start_codon:yes stop_codon:yes gene_type:complete
MSKISIGAHKVNDVVVSNHVHRDTKGDGWFVTKDILVVNTEGEEILQITLFAEHLSELKFKTVESYEGREDDIVTKRFGETLVDDLTKNDIDKRAVENS